MTFPTLGDLIKFHCSNAKLYNGNAIDNPYYEPMARRRYNCSPRIDTDSFRLVFLREVIKSPRNKTLLRKGRFIWCSNLSYEGLSPDGYRQISFSVDSGAKRFTVEEKDVLCIPSKSYINNSRFFRTAQKTFIPFSSVFSYLPCLRAMGRNSDLNSEDVRQQINADNRFKPGTLVAPRLGYFYPYSPNGVANPIERTQEHPCGLILGASFDSGDSYGREFYRVRFGATTYERVHPIQLEIINEV